MQANGRSYAQCGIAWLRLYPTIQTLPAGTELEKPLKPALGIGVVELNPSRDSFVQPYQK